MQTNQLSKQVMLYGCLLSMAGTALANPPKAPVAGCAPPKAKYDFSVNRVRATLLNNGSNFFADGKTTYFVDKEEKRTTVFSSGLWMGGLAGGILKTAGQTYSGGVADEYWPGPLDTSGMVSPETCAEYDKHQFVSAAEVAAFVKGGPLTDNIRNWPGNAKDGRKLAPFFDKDNDGKYDPSKGDYPQVKGDGMAWCVFNDIGNFHTMYKGNPIGIEVQQSTFGFDNPYIHLDQTIFQQYKMTYFGSSKLDSFHVGLFVDLDLGNQYDDYIGCDPSNNTFFAYNGDDFDEGENGYGAVTPSIGFRILEGIEDATHSNVRMSKFMYFSNGTGGGPTNDPSNDLELYRFLTGSWRTPVRLTYGGTGYNPSSTDYADFAFPGTKDPKSRPEWTEKIANNPSGDRRGVASMGPISLIPGAVIDFTIGIPFAAEGDSETSLDSMISYGEQQQEFFDGNFQISDKGMAYWKKNSLSSFVGEAGVATIALTEVPDHDIEVTIVPDAAAGTDLSDATLSKLSVIFKAGQKPEQNIDITPLKADKGAHTILRYQLEVKGDTTMLKAGANTLSYVAFAQAEPIANVNTSNTDGVPKRLNEYVVVRGLLYTHSEETSDPFLTLSIADATGGIAIKLTKPTGPDRPVIPVPDWVNLNGYTDIWVYGKVSQLHGITVLESQEFIISPQKSGKEAKAITKVVESNESDFIVFKSCSIVDSAEWKNAKTRATEGVRFSNGTDTVRVLVPKGTYITPKTPLKNVDIYGTGYQVDNTSPYTSTYSLRITHERFIVPQGKPLSVKEIQSAEGLEVFPNPMTDALSIRSTAARIQHIELFDLQGKKVFEQSGLNTLEAKLNVEQALSKGIYLLSVQQEGNKRTLRKIMVN